MTLDDRLLKVFHTMFDDTVVLHDDTTADDIEDWDSLHHINLMYLIEEEFGVRFAGNQLAEMADVGELKAFLTDLGSEVANLGVQVWGGHGYIHENGMEQLVRDARICQIYEGTNGVQAMDLIGRKLPAHTGRTLRAFFHPLRAWLDEHADSAADADFVQPLAKAFGRLQTATGRIAIVGLGDADAAAAVATDYLRLFGFVAMGYCWARAAEAARRRLDNGEGDALFLRAKLDTARFFMARLLPQTGALLSSVMAGGVGVTSFEDAAF